jgi:hypothetical protein
MENSNNWIDEAFKSVQNQKQPTLNADLFSRIEHRINQQEAKIVLMPIWKVAVAAAVIIFINLLAFKNISTTEQKFETTEYELSANYNFYADE